MASFLQCPNFLSFNGSFSTFSSDSFTVIHVNIRSIRKYWDEFKIIVHDVRDQIDAIVLTEINVSADYMSEFRLQYFKSFFYTRQNARGGGICVFIKEPWSATQTEVLFQHSECLTLKISNSNRTVCLLALYRPPSSSCTNFLKELKENLGEFSNETNLCLVGDMNIDTTKISNSLVCEYLSILAENGITSTIASPTREEVLNGNLVSSCLDHIDVRASDVRAC